MKSKDRRMSRGEEKCAIRNALVDWKMNRNRMLTVEYIGGGL